jgi:carboxyl-terminal processing protease
MHWADSLKKTVYTAGGRPLISFDGITPDIILKRVPEPPVILDLVDWNSTHLFRYANRYFTLHPEISSAATFRISDKDYDDFISFLKKENFQLTSQSEKQLDVLQKSLEEENYQTELLTEISKLRAQLNQEKEKQYILYKKQIKSLLEGEIVSQYFYNSGRVENSLKDDEELKKAMEVLSNWERYKKVLNW